MGKVPVGEEGFISVFTRPLITEEGFISDLSDIFPDEEGFISGLTGADLREGFISDPGSS